MLYTATLDNYGRLINVRLGKVHGNTKYTFTIEAERLIDAEFEARERAPDEWNKVQAKPRPGPKPSGTRCKCTLPVGTDGINCNLCRIEKENAAKKPVNPTRDARLQEALEIQAHWQHLPNVGAFTKWLNERIASLRSPR